MSASTLTAKQREATRFFVETKRCAMCFDEVTTTAVLVVLRCAAVSGDGVGGHVICGRCADATIAFSRNRTSIGEEEEERAKEGEEMRCPICQRGTRIERKAVEEVPSPAVKEVMCFQCDTKATAECKRCKLAVCSNEECQVRLKTLHERLRENEHVPEMTAAIAAHQRSSGREAGMCEEHREKRGLFSKEDEVPVCSRCLLIGLFASILRPNRNQTKQTPRATSRGENGARENDD